MFEDIEKAAAELANSRAGWVTRRDGATYLGEAAVRAVTALKRHEDEPDVDVSRGIRKALAEASRALQGIAPAKAEAGLPLEEMVRRLEKPGRREVSPHGNGFKVAVHLKEGRQQTVYVAPYKRTDGLELVRIYTYCSPERDDVSEWALRLNAKLNQCAFAIFEEDGRPMLVLMNAYLAGETTAREIHVAVKEVAYYGDWVERKLTGQDDF